MSQIAIGAVATTGFILGIVNNVQISDLNSKLIPGADGPSGLPGASGPSGLPGASGPSGLPGASGLSGGDATAGTVTVSVTSGGALISSAILNACFVTTGNVTSVIISNNLGEQLTVGVSASNQFSLLIDGLVSDTQANTNLLTGLGTAVSGTVGNVFAMQSISAPTSTQLSLVFVNAGVVTGNFAVSFNVSYFRQ